MVIGTKYWQTLNEDEKEWMKEAAKSSVPKQKEFWENNVAECMAKIKAANVEVFYPDKSQFAEKSKSILQKLTLDPKMGAIINQIQSE